MKAVAHRFQKKILRPVSVQRHTHSGNLKLLHCNQPTYLPTYSPGKVPDTYASNKKHCLKKEGDNECVECKKREHCTDGANSVCDTKTNTCARTRMRIDIQNESELMNKIIVEYIDK